MANITVLQLVFITCRSDLHFIFKFRKICRTCKNISEEWLTEISDNRFLKQVEVSCFRNLKVLVCSDDITDKSVQHLTSLTSLDACDNDEITDKSVRHLTSLTSLNAWNNQNITDVS